MTGATQTLQLAAATRAGRAAEAIAAVYEVREKIPVEEHPKMQNVVAVPLYALVRFGRWDEIPTAPRARLQPAFRSGGLALRSRDGLRIHGPLRRG